VGSKGCADRITRHSFIYLKVLAVPSMAGVN